MRFVVLVADSGFTHGYLGSRQIRHLGLTVRCGRGKCGANFTGDYLITYKGVCQRPPILSGPKSL